MKAEDIKKNIKQAYGQIASGSGCCGSSCGTENPTDLAQSLGYSDEELKNIPQEANLGLSCGNPTAIASLNKGEVVLDLGSGAGFDCFLAASRVGPTGKVIGVDMTPEMIQKAKNNATKNKVENVEFRQGEIENLPLDDNSVDVVISNCVINLSTDKQKVFAEIHRVLKPGGRIVISDIALVKELPEKVRESIAAYVGCVGGAILLDEYKNIVLASGLKDVKVTIRGGSCGGEETTDPIGKAIFDSVENKESLLESIVSISVEAYK